MEVLPISELKVALSEIKNIDTIMQSTFRLTTFSRQHKVDDLLNAYFSSRADFNELLSLKNAQMEAQTAKGAASCLITLNKTLSTVISEIESKADFKTELQLFHLFRSI